MAIEAGEPILASDFIDESAGAADAAKGVKTGADGKIDPSFFTAAHRVLFFIKHTFGDSTTQFDITKTGDTVRYTYDGTGTDPRISELFVPVGSVLNIQGANFNAANKVDYAIVTGVGSNYFEIENPNGVAESNKTIGGGSIAGATAWTKPDGLKALYLRATGGGAGGGGGRKTSTSVGGSQGGGGGGGGATVPKMMPAAILPASVPVAVGEGGDGGAGGTSNGSAGSEGGNGNTTTFGNNSTEQYFLRAYGGGKGYPGTSSNRPDGGAGGGAMGNGTGNGNGQTKGGDPGGTQIPSFNNANQYLWFSRDADGFGGAVGGTTDLPTGGRAMWGGAGGGHGSGFAGPGGGDGGGSMFGGGGGGGTKNGNVSTGGNGGGSGGWDDITTPGQDASKPGYGGGGANQQNSATGNPGGNGAPPGGGGGGGAAMQNHATWNAGNGGKGGAGRLMAIEYY